MLIGTHLFSLCICNGVFGYNTDFVQVGSRTISTSFSAFWIAIDVDRISPLHFHV